MSLVTYMKQIQRGDVITGFPFNIMRDTLRRARDAPPIDSQNTRGVTSVLPACWEVRIVRDLVIGKISDNQASDNLTYTTKYNESIVSRRFSVKSLYNCGRAGSFVSKHGSTTLKLREMEMHFIIQDLGT
uniref:SFRICE_007099 n=1 Tax=Spodoptera frugiperda TaxID=7108 RepID=A0A2H1VQA4_SPOFR